MFLIWLLYWLISFFWLFFSPLILVCTNCAMSSPFRLKWIIIVKIVLIIGLRRLTKAIIFFSTIPEVFFTFIVLNRVYFSSSLLFGITAMAHNFINIDNRNYTFKLYLQLFHILILSKKSIFFFNWSQILR